jgi:hypothetical protein
MISQAVRASPLSYRERYTDAHLDAKDIVRCSREFRVTAHIPMQVKMIGSSLFQVG